MPSFLSVLATTGHWAVWIIGGAGLLVTLLPIFRQTAWWIRICDFPRLQIVVGAAPGVWARPCCCPTPRSFGHSLFVVSLAVAVGYQLSRIWPYTPAAPQAGIRCQPPGR